MGPRSFCVGPFGPLGTLGNLFLANLFFPQYTPAVSPPFPVDELLQKLTDLQSAVNTGKDSL